ncbi:MAG: LysR family transcriptional regulator, partial [Blautia sp.]|nr:LysR family transcriptional regulator [Blautia sp.]
MNLKHLDYFLVLPESRNVSDAARRLGISQPVLNRHLRGLEEELGTCLYKTEKKGIVLTEAGQIYYRAASRIKELHTQMIRQLNETRGVGAQTLSIGIPPNRGGFELAGFYPDLLSRFPMLDLQVFEGHTFQLLKALKEGRISLAITLYDKQLMPDVRIATTMTGELMLELPNDLPYCVEYRKKHGSGAATPQNLGTITEEELRSLKDVPFVYQDTQTVVGHVADRCMQECGFVPNTFLRSPNSVAVYKLIESGSYAGFLFSDNPPYIPGICFFHLPKPQFLYYGILFRRDYDPGEMERYLY